VLASYSEENYEQNATSFLKKMQQKSHATQFKYLESNA